MEYGKMLKEQGFQGMLVTDHDSYRGYRAWEAWKREHPEECFQVIRGIEYDTMDAGHMLIIMPDEVHLRILELRGLPLMILIRLVHRYGGIIGPAHPYGARSFSFQRKIESSWFQKALKEMDFIEIFNIAESFEANEKAKQLAEQFGKPGTFGSDAHRLHHIGWAYTVFDTPIETANDMIAAIQQGHICGGGGMLRKKKAKILTARFPVGYSFRVYHRVAAFYKKRSRKREYLTLMHMTLRQANRQQKREARMQ